MSDQLPVMAPPHSRSAEEAVLGAGLIDSECIRKINLRPEEFYLVRNGWIWNAMQELTRKGTTPNILTVASSLYASGRLEEVGGQAYLIGLVTACPSTYNVESYAGIVRERAKRRDIIQIANNLAQGSFDLDSDMSEIINAAKDGLNRGGLTAKSSKHISEFLGVLYEQVDAATQNPCSQIGINTGFLDWNARGGPEKQTVLKLSGEPGIGKSLLAFQVLMNAASTKPKPFIGALFQLEMSGVQVVRRGVSATSGITTRNMKTGNMKGEEFPLFTAAIEAMSSMDIYISDASEMTTQDIRVDCQRLKDLNGLDLIVVDYEGLLEDRGENEIERQNTISKRVKALAKDLDIAVITIGDMLKEGIQGKVKGMGAQGGSGRTLHDRDEIVTLSQDNGIENLYHLKWDKHREGGGGTVDLVRTAGIPVFRDAQKPEPKPGYPKDYTR
jgi:replicative DNA helicase